MKKQEEQMFKQYYCKMCTQMKTFVQHTDRKNIWICTHCRFATSTPMKKPKVTKLKFTFK
jgi:ribosomal protein L37AE/L43A